MSNSEKVRAWIEAGGKRIRRDRNFYTFVSRDGVDLPRGVFERLTPGAPDWVQYLNLRQQTQLLIAISGGRGCGKTTAAQTIAALYEALGCTVRVEDGGDVTTNARLSVKDAKKMIRASPRKPLVVIKTRQY